MTLHNSWFSIAVDVIAALCASVNSERRRRTISLELLPFVPFASADSLFAQMQLVAIESVNSILGLFG